MTAEAQRIAGIRMALDEAAMLEEVAAMTGAREPSRRGKCRWCGRTFALTKLGRVRRHRAKVAGAVFGCAGSGQIPS